MRGVLAILVVAGCSFRSGIVPEQRDAPGARDDAPGMHDAAARTDATVISPDAPCPDDDMDGVCNADDDWPCGAKPAAPASSVTAMRNGTKSVMTVSMVTPPLLRVASPNAPVNFTVQYRFTDTACAACQDQLEIGWVPGHRAGCWFDGAVQYGSTIQSDVGVNLTTPSTPGEADVRVNLGQRLHCNDGTDWWAAPPPPDDTLTIMRVCVH